MQLSSTSSPITSGLVDFQASPTQTSPKTLKVLNNVWGAILSFFGQALKVEQADGKVNYVKISELKETFIFSKLQGLNEKEAKLARNDQIIHNLFLSTVNPMKGATISKSTLDKFNEKSAEFGLNYSSADPKNLYSSLRKIRAAIHTEKGMTENQKEFISGIKLGDIIFHRTDDTIHSDIVEMQRKMSKIGIGAKHRDGINHNHVYMCAKIDEFGKKWFAEAAWPSGKRDEIRLISEDDVQRCFLKQNHGAISEVFHCTNSELASKAAEEACNITTQLPPQEKDVDEEQPSDLSYSKIRGAKALLFSTSFGHMAKARLFKWIQSSNHGEKPADFKKSNNYFCSYLVGCAYQMAEARPIINRLTKGQTKSDSVFVNVAKAHFSAMRFRNTLDKEMQFTVDTRHCTPSDLYSWVSEHKELFTAGQSYQQPNDEAHVA